MRAVEVVTKAHGNRPFVSMSVERKICCFHALVS
jgi:hypothetical protein